MADFSHIQSIQTVVPSGSDPNKSSMLHLRVAGSSELLSVNCPSLAVAENMADLIDGYCRLVNNSKTSIWNKKGKLLLIVISCCSKLFSCKYTSCPRAGF
jgi:focal adhesion kinase 1